MRGRGAVARIFSGLLAVAVAGCNVLEGRFYREGIGSELYGGSETVTATEYQDAYLGLICRQAGLPIIINADGAAYCDQAADWGLVVQAGMNDIDRRCDAYLAWLDDKRRSNEPFLKELAAISASTLGVLDATSAGVKAITITGIAFGLAANTFVNINSRLLSLEQSTVQSVVLDSQQRYRQNNSTSSINTRPAAIYYLRNYLRICLPFSIETSINNTVTVFHRAGPGALADDTIFTRTVVTDAARRIRIPDAPARVNAPNRLTVFERSKLFTRTHVKDIQRSLCVPTIDGEIGPEGSDTRRAINEFLIAMGQKNASGMVTEHADNLLSDAIDAVPDCKGAGLAQPKDVAARLKKS